MTSCAETQKEKLGSTSRAKGDQTEESPFRPDISPVGGVIAPFNREMQSIWTISVIPVP